MIQRCGRKLRVVLKVLGEDLDWGSNYVEKVFFQMGHIRFVGGSNNLEFLPEFHHMEENCFDFIGYRISEEVNGINDVVENRFEFPSRVN